MGNVAEGMGAPTPSAAGTPSKFHRVCGKNVELSEGDTVAKRVRSYDNGVVFTDQPVPVGTVFQIKVLEVGLARSRFGSWSGSLSFGFTTVCPDKITVPPEIATLRSENYWVLSHSGGLKHGSVPVKTYLLRTSMINSSGRILGCMVNKNGDLHYFVDGEDQGLAFEDLPTDQPLWGVADIFAQVTMIKSEFYISQKEKCSNSSQLEEQLRGEPSHVQDLQQRLDEAAQQLQQQWEIVATTREESQQQLQGLQQSLDEAAQQQREEVAQQREEAAVREQESPLQLQNLQQRLEEAVLVQQNTEVMQQLDQQGTEAAVREQESQQRLDAATKQLQQQRGIVARTREESQQQLQDLRQSLDEAAKQLQQQREEVAQQRVEATRQREEAAEKEQESQLQLQNLQQRLEEAVEQNREVMQQLDQQGTEAAVREQESQSQLQLLQQRLDTATAELQQLCSSPQVASQHGIEAWMVPRGEVQLLGEMDRGAWGVVARGRYQGQLVAVKWPHPAILSEHTTERLRREVQIMAQVCHPNLLRFIAAVFDDQMPRLPPLIVMELLDTNLRTAYQKGRLSGDNKIPIFRDVAYALHNLHEHQEPIIHRDVSAPNVLLEELPNQMWRAKVSDFGSANLARVAQTMGEGAIIYAAPETIPQAYDSDTTPPPQTTKIDVYSYGVLLCEVITCQLPDPAQYRSMLRQIQSQWQFMHELIIHCTKRNPEDRPTMVQVLGKLNTLPNSRSRQRS